MPDNTLERSVMSGKIDKLLQNRTVVYFDSSPIIYFIEEHPSYVACVQELFRRVDAGLLSAFSSYITLIEVLIKPLEKKAYDIARAYRDLLADTPGFSLYPVERTVSEKAAELRARYGAKNLKTPDAIQIATALSFGAELFVTNDADLKRVKEIDVVTLNDFN